jgi:CheY-like chemotaxis protein
MLDSHAPDLLELDEPPTAQHLLLYIEDSHANIQLVEQLVARRPDLKLMTAKTGYTGIELARQYFPDVIIMDINLPDISGLQALDILQKDTETAHIPVLALSSDAFPGSIHAGLKAGFYRYLTKPYRIDVFLQQLDETLALALKSRQQA